MQMHNQIKKSNANPHQSVHAQFVLMFDLHPIFQACQSAKRAASIGGFAVRSGF
jgi:hypothetical protein